MKKEKVKKGLGGPMEGKKKIQSIRIENSMLEDPKMDEMLKKSIMEEADRIEKELNEDPSLQGIGASDDMFDKIKATLQQQGVWEEDDPDDSQKKASTGEKHTDPKKNQENIQDHIQENTQEKTQGNTQEDSREDTQENIYSLLSKEDQEALRLGKKIRKRRKKRWKQLAATAAAVLVVFCAGMSGEASRRWMLDAWNKITSVTGISVRTDYMDNEISRRSDSSMYSEEEQKAWEKIRIEISAPAVIFGYLPKEMEFINYEIMKETNEASVFYSYKNAIFSTRILVGKKTTSFYLQSDVEPLLRETVEIDQDISINIWDTTTKGIESYMAECEVQDCTIVFEGMLSLNEFKKIIKNIDII